MTRCQIQRFAAGATAFLNDHATWRAQRGRRPSMPYIKLWATLKATRSTWYRQ
ncbi:MAG: hypothetical protein WC675_05025 [Patescibacteria group bacterium]